MLRIFKNLSRKDWGFVIISIAFIVVQVWLDLKLPDYMSEITLLIQMPQTVMAEVLTAGGKMLICALGSLVSSICVAVCAARISSSFAATLRRVLFNKVQSFSLEEISNFSTASLITRSTNDVVQVQMLIVMGLQSIIKAPIVAIWAIAKIYGKSVEWTITTGIAIAVLLVIVFSCISLALPKFKRLQSLTDETE